MADRPNIPINKVCRVAGGRINVVKFCVSKVLLMALMFRLVLLIGWSNIKSKRNNVWSISKVSFYTKSCIRFAGLMDLNYAFAQINCQNSHIRTQNRLTNLQEIQHSEVFLKSVNLFQLYLKSEETASPGLASSLTR